MVSKVFFVKGRRRPCWVGDAPFYLRKRSPKKKLHEAAIARELRGNRNH